MPGGGEYQAYGLGASIDAEPSRLVATPCPRDHDDQTCILCDDEDAA